jgi:hypothetical protein
MKNRNLKEKVTKLAVRTKLNYDMYSQKESPLESNRRMRVGNEKKRDLKVSIAELATTTNEKAIAFVQAIHSVGFTFKMKRDGIRFDVVKL